MGGAGLLDRHTTIVENIRGLFFSMEQLVKMSTLEKIDTYRQGRASFDRDRDLKV
jgi:hypothetical protein